MQDFIKHICDTDATGEDIQSHFHEVINTNFSAFEIAESIKKIRSKATFFVNFPESIDVCGTGGSQFKNRLNTSTLVAIKLSQQGVKVVKSGNKSASGNMGSIDLLEKIGYELPEEKNLIEEYYKQKGLAFLYANSLYPFLGRLAKLRKEYGKPTIFNIIGPLLSPGNPRAEIIGCSFENRMDLMIEICRELGKKRVMIVRGDDGLDEVTLSNSTQVCDLRDGKISKYTITPEEFGYSRTQIQELNDNERISISINIINGQETSNYNDLVDINVKVVHKLLLK